MHEFGHILHGHIGYFNSFSRLPFAEKSDTAGGSVLTNLDRQTLEMDADSYATNVTIRELIQWVGDSSLVQENSRQFYRDWRTAFKTWTVAVYVQARLLSAMNDSLNLKSSDHPLPGLRSALIFGNIFSLFEEFKISTPKETGAIINSAVTDVETAFDQITTQREGYSDLIFMFSKSVHSQLTAVMKNWNHLRPALLKYAFKSIAKVYEE